MRPRSLHDFQDVAAHLVIDVNLAHRFLTGQHFRGRHDGIEVVDGMAVLEAHQHFAFFLMRGITEAEADEEAVELGLRQGERAFVVDGVLRGDDHEGRLEA